MRKQLPEQRRQPVFVSDADGKVYRIAGKVDAKKHLDYKMRVNGDTATAEQIAKAVKP